MVCDEEERESSGGEHSTQSLAFAIQVSEPKYKHRGAYFRL